MTVHWSGWALDDPAALLDRLAGAGVDVVHPVVVCDHVTLARPADRAPDPARVVVVGVAHDADVQALVVEVDGARVRPDGEVFHVTLSLRPGVEQARSKGMLQSAVVSPVGPWVVPVSPVLRKSRSRQDNWALKIAAAREWCEVTGRTLSQCPDAEKTAAGWAIGRWARNLRRRGPESLTPERRADVEALGLDWRPPGRTSRRYSDADRLRAVAAYRGGATLLEAGERVGAAGPTVAHWCRRAGVPLRGEPAPQRRRRYGLSERQVAIDAYRAGATLSDAAATVGAVHSTLEFWLREAGVPLRVARARPYGSATYRRALALIDAGATTSVAAEQAGVHEATLRRWLTEAGVTTRAMADRQRSAGAAGDALELVRSGLTMTEAARRTGVHQTSVANWLRRACREAERQAYREGLSGRAGETGAD